MACKCRIIGGKEIVLIHIREPVHCTIERHMQCRSHHIGKMMLRPRIERPHILPRCKRQLRHTRRAKYRGGCSHTEQQEKPGNQPVRPP